MKITGIILFQTVNIKNRRFQALKNKYLIPRRPIFAANEVTKR